MAVIVFSVFVLSIILFSYVRRTLLSINNKNNSLLIVAGSGGHTKEILTLIKTLNVRYSPRYYVIAATDTISVNKIKECEEAMYTTSLHRNKYDVFAIPRSREVKQSWLTSLFTTLFAAMYSVHLVIHLRPAVILCNGPGTCVPICYAGYFLRVLGITGTMIVYVESICRVETLSLSAKLICPIVNSLIVQWPSLQKRYPKCQYIGRLA